MGRRTRTRIGMRRVRPLQSGPPAIAFWLKLSSQRTTTAFSSSNCATRQTSRKNAFALLASCDRGATPQWTGRWFAVAGGSHSTATSWGITRWNRRDIPMVHLTRMLTHATGWSTRPTTTSLKMCHALIVSCDGIGTRVIRAQAQPRRVRSSGIVPTSASLLQMGRR